MAGQQPALRQLPGPVHLYQVGGSRQGRPFPLAGRPAAPASPALGLRLPRGRREEGPASDPEGGLGRFLFSF